MSIDYAALNERVAQEFACTHPDVRLAYTEKSNGVRTYCDQCTTCGANTRTHKKADLGAQMFRAMPFDRELVSSWYERRNERFQELRDEAQQQADAQWWRWYNRYLQTPAWRERRARVLRRAGGICEGCGVRPAAEVHHLTYDRVGNEMLFDLVAVCNDCHKEIHPRHEGREAAAR